MEPEQLIAAVRRHADEVLERCADRYGERRTPLLIDGFGDGREEPIRWEGHVLSNPARQQNFARLLVGLSYGDKICPHRSL